MPASSSSPRSWASWRRSTRCCSPRWVGVCTASSTSRSPRPRPSGWGTPSLRRRLTVPAWVPGSTSTVSGPSRVSSSTAPPRAATLEDRMGVDGQLDDEVARRPAVLAGVTPARVADLVAVLQPGRDVDRQGGVLHEQALAAALLARRADLLAAAGAHRAGGGGDELAEQGLADGPLLAGAVAARADGRLGALLGARPAAAPAGRRGAHPDVLGGAEHRLGERQAQAHADALAAARPRAGPRPARERVAAAEERP